MAIEAKVTKRDRRSLAGGIGSTRNGILIATYTDVHGYGFANILVGVTASHFRDLAEAMMTVNADEASKAFGNALKDGVTATREFKPLELTLDKAIGAATDKAIRERGLLDQLLAKARLRRP